MDKIRMLTVVPTDLAAQLVQKRRITDYNTLPQINKSVMKIVKEIMTQKVGYENLPMACLSGVSNTTEVSGENIISYLPLNNKNSVVFQLEMPSDMVLSIPFSTLLDISNQADMIDDPKSPDFEYIREELEDEIILGFDQDIIDPISFIPFLAVDRCQCFVCLTDKIHDGDLHMSAVSEMSLKALSSFN